MATFILTGRVVRKSDNAPLSKLLVEAWDKYKIYNEALETALTNNDGLFEMRFDKTKLAELYNDQLPDVYFKIYSNQMLLFETASSVIVNVSNERNDILIALDYAGQITPRQSSYVVKGVILQDNYQPAKDHAISIMDKGIIKDQVLGTARTNEKGEFETSFDPGLFIKSGKTSPDIFLQISADKKTSYKTKVINNAPSFLEIKEVIGGGAFPRLSEFEFIASKLQPLLNNVPILEVKEHDTNHPFRLLAAKTGVQENKVKWFVQSHQLAADTKMQPEFYYALLRGQLGSEPLVKVNEVLSTDINIILPVLQAFQQKTPIDNLPFSIASEPSSLADTFANLPDDAIAGALAHAVKAGAIPATSHTGREELTKKWGALKDERQAKLKSQFQRLLDTTGMKAQEKKSMSALFDTHKGVFKNVMDDATENKSIKDESLNELQASLRVTELVQDPALAASILSVHKFKSPKQLSKLARLSESEWTKFSNGTGTASVKPVMSALAKEFPTAHFIGKLERDDKPLVKAKEKVISFFDAYPELELHKINFDLFFHKNKETQKQFKEPNELKTELKRIQRVFKLAPDYEKARQLLDNDIHSAQGIYRMGQKRFIEKIAGGAISPAEAKKIYKKAERTHAAALALLGEIKSLEQGSTLNVLPDVRKTYGALKHSTMKDFPDWKTIFTSPDICECEQCRSVCSPASYLTDVLHWLDKRGSTTPGMTAKEVLFKRRPDMAEIDLNCDNSNVAIPYTDLVAEILEDGLADVTTIVSNAILPLLLEGTVHANVLTEFMSKGLELVDDAVVTTGSTSSIWFIRDKLHAYKVQHKLGQVMVSVSKQTHDTTAERKAMPEYINYTAYETVLKNARHPITLPFDLGWEETRAYLDKVEIGRAKWMEEFRDRATLDPTDAEIATEFLGLSPVEGAIISTANAAAQNTFWGGLVNINQVAVFIQKAEIEYKDLIQLLKVKFINPLGDSKIVHLDTTCDTEQKTISNLDAAKLDRINRFLRLWKKIGWKMWELDNVIMNPVLGNGLLDTSLLINLKPFIQLRTSLKLSVEELLAYYGDIIIDGDTPHYKKLFRNKVILEPLPDAFREELVTESPFPGPAPADRTVTAQLKSLAAVLKVRQEEIIEIQATSLTDDDLSLSNISTIFRIASLIRKQKLKAKEFYLLMEILNTGGAFDVFQDPQSTMDFLDIVKFIKASKFAVTELVYLLLNRDEAPKLLIPSDETLTTFIGKGRTALQKVKDELEGLTGTSAEVAQSLIGKLTYTDATGNQVTLDQDDVNTFTQIFNGTYADTLAARDAFLDATFGPVIATATVKAALNTRDAAPANMKDEETANAYTALNTLLKEYLSSNSSRQAVYQVYADQFKMDDDFFKRILDSVILPGLAVPMLELWFDPAFLAKDPVTGAYVNDITVVNFPDLYNSGRLTAKISFLQKKLPLNNDTIDLLLTNAADFSIIAYNELPVSAPVAASNYDKWKSYVQLYQFSANYPDHEYGTLSGVLRKLLPPADTEPNFLAAMAEYTLWDVDELTALVAQLGLAFPADYMQMQTYADLDTCMNLLTVAGIEVDQVALLIKPAPAALDAINVKQLIKSKYEHAQWLDTSTNIQNIIREKKRNALIAYYTHHTVHGNTFEDANELYSYHLLDVEMGACELTTRILQANLSCQLFVQRCLMNLELEVTADVNTDDGWLQWAWMKNYRVWEANRKVFLYPENWIEPELRLDKSPFFKELENDLMQNEINQVNVENAYLSYLEKLDNVARLDVCGYYYEHETYTLHVFARTYDDPNIYYYRKFIEERYWTPWEKVDLEINATHVIPIVINQRVYLYWPDFREKAIESSSATVPKLPGSTSSTATIDLPYKKWEIRLAVSEFRNKKWTPKKISKTFIDTYSTQTLPPSSNYSFIPLDLLDVADRYIVGCFENTSPTDWDTYSYNDVGFFDLGSCKGTPEKLEDNDLIGLLDGPILSQFERSELKFLESQEAYTDPAQDALAFQQGTFINHRPILEKTPNRFRAPLPGQLSYFDKIVAWIYWTYIQILKKNGIEYGREWPFPYTTGTFLPFFYEDKQRTFFVQHEILLALRRDRKEDSNENGNGNGLQVTELFYTNIIQIIEEFKRTGEIPDLIKPYFGQGVKPLAAYKLKFNNFYHPHVCFLIKQYYKSAMESAGYAPDGSKYTLDGFFRREIQLLDPIKFPEIKPFSFKNVYSPTPIVNPGLPIPGDPTPYYPKEVIDFTASGSYSDYNWELFFHAPLMLATGLSRNQRFEEAMHWFHYIFNPTDTSSHPSPQKFWITKPFFERSSQEYLDQRIDNILTMVNSGDGELIKQVDDWRRNAFQPHLIAKFRTVAYQKTVVMKYLDNLIAWGDNLFRSDRREAIGEATQLYILAADILGPKPKVIPRQADAPVLNYSQIEPKLDTFSNAMIGLENFIPYMEDDVHEFDSSIPLPSLVTFYYCIPQNDKLLGYWDTIADRLFKIRHCMNIEGIERQLALFDPPIDPGLLVKAVASGVSIGAAIAGLNAPLPPYRFQIMVQKANEFCSEVKTLGSLLLSALEKKDAESLALLRSTQEIRMHEAVKQVKKKQIEEARENIEGLKRTKVITEEKKKYYGSLSYMNAAEIVAFGLSTASTILDAAIAAGYILTGGLKAVPQFVAGGSGFGGSPHVVVDIGGVQFGDVADAATKTISSISHALDKGASLASTQGTYQRRQEEWNFQKLLAEKELLQIEKQISAAEIRQALAEKELENQELQIEHSKATDEFMRTKFTNRELYEWMIGQLSGVYFQTYQLAYDLAKKAERCYRYELGIADTSFVQFGYWDSLKKGLHSGERLSLDLRRMESSWFDQNKREFEIVKHVSLTQLDPMALLKLKQTGACFFQLPEEIYDIDYPGHYFRRIKSAGVSIPCIIGPYSSVNCTLTILKSRIRTSAIATNVDYSVPPTEDDPGFTFNFSAIQSIVTSTGQNDSGLFEANLKDERYLPFEGHGAISEWKLEMNKEFKNFDFETISDVILHVRYTARQGGKVLGTAVQQQLTNNFDQIIKTYENGTGFFKLISMKTDFPTELYRLLHPGALPPQVDLNVTANHVPYWLSGKTLEFDPATAAQVFLKAKQGQTINTAGFAVQLNGQAVAFAPPSNLGDLKIGTSTQMGDFLTTWNLSAAAGNLDPVEVDDVLILVKYMIV